MNLDRFVSQLPELYHDWGTPTVRPQSEQFVQVLRQVPGMTTPSVLQLLNFAVACLEREEVYCEVGCFQGATLIGAMLGHAGRRAYAADNFSQFDPEGENRGLLQRNLAAFDLVEAVQFHCLDYEDFLHQLRGYRIPLGVYFYDGAHDYRSQLLGLLLAAPLLAHRALIVVDDGNWPAVKQAVWDFIAVQPECRLLFELPTPRNRDPSFWNGLYVLGWDIERRNGYDRKMFLQARQTALLESLAALQWVSIRMH